jgi:hypothetical protein
MCISYSAAHTRSHIRYRYYVSLLFPRYLHEAPTASHATSCPFYHAPYISFSYSLFMFPAHACLHILSPLCTLTYHVVSLSNSLLLVICIRITSSFLLLLRQTAIFTFSFLRTYFKLSYTTRFSICVMPHPHTYWFMHVIAHMQNLTCSSYSHISHQHTLRTSPHHCFCTKSKPFSEHSNLDP